MTLLLNNKEIEKVLTMKVCMDALEVLYKELGEGQAGSFARQDLHAPTRTRDAYAGAPVAHYTKIMGGVTPAFGMSAVRISSDIVAFPMKNGVRRRIKIPAASGNKWLGLIFLFDSGNGELIAIMNDGFLSRMRVGGANGLAARYLARADAKTVGLLGSGWQAGAQLMALKEVRPIERVRVFSPTKDNREKFAKTMTKQLGIEVRAVGKIEDAVRDADILVTATNSRQSFVSADFVGKGMHVSCLQRDELQEAAYRKADVLVINTKIVETNFTSKALAELFNAPGFELRDHPAPPDIAWESLPTLGDLMTQRCTGRTSAGQITAFVNNIGHGAQFAAVGARVYQLAKARGLGKELPTEWFLEDIHP